MTLIISTGRHELTENRARSKTPEILKAWLTIHSTTKQCRASKGSSFMDYILH